MQLTNEQITRLVAAFKEAFTLDELKLVVPKAFPKTLEDIVPPKPLEQSILELLLWAARHDRLVELLKVACAEKPTNIHLAEAATAVIGAAAHDLVPATTLNEVVRHIGSADPPFAREELLRAYRLSVPSVLAHELDDFPSSMLTSILVGRLTSTMDTPPGRKLVAFLLQLRSLREADLDFTSGLDAWLKVISNALGIGEVQAGVIANAVQQSLARAAQQRLHVIVVVSPEKDRSGQFRVDVHHVITDVLTERWHEQPFDCYRVPRTCTRDALDGVVVEEMAAVVREQRRGDEEVVVHLFLPLVLWSCEADRWKWPRKRGQPQPIGAEFRVLLRSYDRAFDTSFDEDNLEWRKVWKEYAGSNPPVVMKAGRELFQGNYRMRRQKDRDTCAALDFVPSPQQLVEENGVGSLLLESGTPIAVWFRQELEPNENLSQIVDSLVPVPREWIDRVTSHRVDAAGGGCRFGEHLVLMWDDPDKLPPTALNRKPYVEPK